MNFPVARCRCDAHTCHCACMLILLLAGLRERSKNKIVLEFSLLHVHHWRSHDISRYGSVCVYDARRYVSCCISSARNAIVGSWKTSLSVKVHLAAYLLCIIVFLQVFRLFNVHVCVCYSIVFPACLMCPLVCSLLCFLSCSS